MTPIEVGGFRGCYEDDAGTGRVIVLLVTPFARAVLYRRTVQALRARGYRVLIVEMPGCGCGSRLAPGWGFEQYAAWVAGFLEALGLSGVILIGHSSSAATAVYVGARHPARVGALVLADPVGARGPRSVLLVLAGTLACGVLEIGFALRLVPRALLNLWRHTRNFAVQFWRSVRADLRPIAPDVAAPALVAWGSWDWVMPSSGAQRLAGLMPNGALHVEPRAGHDWLIVHPTAFAAAVERFVAATAAAADVG